MNQPIGPKALAVLVLSSLILIAIGLSLTAATASTTPLLVTLGVIVASALVVGIALGFRTRSQTKAAIAAGKDPLIELGLSTMRLWGFHSGAGLSVGGGLYTEVALEEGEEPAISVLGFYSRGGWFANGGYLTLTNRRFIFTGSGVPSPFRLRKASVPYQDIESCVLKRVLNLGAWAGSLAPAIVLKTRLSEHYLWPAVVRRDAFAQRLLELKGNSAPEAS